LTKPLWEELAQKISDFCLAIMDYVSLLADVGPANPFPDVSINVAVSGS